jgi:hypothetical protein
VLLEERETLTLPSIQQIDAKETNMYLYSTDGLGDCDVTKKFSVIGSGKDPRDANSGICPLIKNAATGRFIDWQDYSTRSANPKDQLSKFKRFLNEDCYKDFQSRSYCVPDTTKFVPRPIQANQPLPPELIREIVEALTKIRWPQLQPQKPQVPPSPKTLKMRDL